MRFVRNPHGLLHFWLVTFQQEWSHGLHCGAVRPANQAKKLPQPRCQKLPQRPLRLKTWFAKQPLDYMLHNRFPWKRSGRRSSMWPPYSLRRNLSAAACRPCNLSEGHFSDIHRHRFVDVWRWPYPGQVVTGLLKNNGFTEEHTILLVQICEVTERNSVSCTRKISSHTFG